MGKARNEYKRKDLLDELNRLKTAEFGTNAYPITLDQLYLYCNPKNTEVKRYRTFEIKKKNGEPRKISAPYRTLHSIQSALNAFFKEIYTPSDYAMGFTSGRSVVDNANIHVGHNYILNMDLKNFFPSIQEGRVIARLQLPPFCFNKEISQLIGGLCSIRIEDEEGNENFVLPQGAPTSPLLTNAVCDSLDKRLSRLSSKFGVHYSRYADDMTFSSMHNVYQKDSEFTTKILQIIEEEGFSINKNKTRLQKKGSRQEVTGLIVNKKVNVARQYVHELRCILHIWEKYGYADAYARFYPKYKMEKGYIKKGEPVLENVIYGKLNYLRMVKGKEDKVLQKLFARYLALNPCIYDDSETDKEQQFVFIHSYTVEEFENLFETKVQLKASEKDSYIGSCNLFGEEKYISISKHTQKWFKGIGEKDATNRKKNLNNFFLPLCYITLCRKSAKNFWLLTQDKPRKTDIVRLNYKDISLDKLLSVWEKEGIEAAANLFHNYCLENKEKKEKGKEKHKKEKNSFIDLFDLGEAPVVLDF